MDGTDETRVTSPAGILIVDDLPEKHLTYKVILQDLGQEIVEARSGAEALKQVLSRDFAVILLDVNMPGMDGFETARLIHERKRSASTPIIFLTAFADEVRMAQGYATGAVDYLPTPVVPGILRAKVRVFVDLFEMRREIARQAEQRAQQSAVEESNRRLSFLADASARLGRSLDLDATAREIVGVPIPYLAETAVLTMNSSASDGLRMLLARISENADVAVDVIEKTEALPPDLKELLDRASAHTDFTPLISASGIVLPLQARGRRVAVLALSVGKKSHFIDANVVTLCEAFSYRAATALDNCLLHEEIRSSDRQKNDFLSMLAHELRNPLAPIRNAAQLLEYRVPNEPDIKWACEVIDRQVNQLVRLVDDLLDVARITRGKISLRREPIELSAVVNQAVEASRPPIELRQHQLHVELDTTGTWINGDLARLTQVVTNLLNNAAKFTPEGGQIWVETSHQDQWAVLRVRDSGIGIPTSMLASVFDLFTQIDRTLDRSHEGLGIGLTLVKRLVEKHDGTVEARSKGQGRGSEFVIRLPLIKTATINESTEISGNNTMKSQHPCRILVVDDNRDSAQSLSMMLRLMGHDTEVAYDGAEAISLTQAYKPDLILLDIGLPKMNGYEVCRRIREQADGHRISIAALTGWGQEEDHRRSQEAGFDHHFVKPIDIQKLQVLATKVKDAKPECLS